MTPRPIALPALLAVAMALSACASGGGVYPSLSVREGERVTGTFKPVPAKPALPSPPPSADVLDQVAQLRSDATDANQRFLTAAQAAQAPIAAANGAEPGSEEWAVAEVALSNAQARHNETVAALSGLDRIYVAAQMAGNELGKIQAAVDEVSALVDAENKRLNALGASLSQ